MNVISVLVHKESYRGDHSADVAVAHEVRPGETVLDLVDRVMPWRERRGNGGIDEPDPKMFEEWIVIRRVVDAGDHR